MTTTTRNWKFFLERDDVWDVRLFGGGRFDGFVGLQVGRWSLGIEALDDGQVGWSTPLPVAARPLARGADRSVERGSRRLDRWRGGEVVGWLRTCRPLAARPAPV